MLAQPRSLALAVAAALALALPAVPVTAQTVAAVRSNVDADGNLVFRPRSLDELMTTEEREATGIARLTPEQRQALAAWAARRSAAAVALALDARTADGRHVVPSEPRPALVAARDEAPATAAASPVASAAPVETGSVSATRPRRVIPWSFDLSEVRAGGWYVRLGNGSLWEVAPPDRPTAAAWEEGQPIVLRRIGAPTGDFDTSLENAETHQRAAARFAGQSW